MTKNSKTNDVDFKATLWKSAEKLRSQMDAAEYKHIVLGLIFLKYISDKFDIQRNKIKKMVSDKKSDFFISEDPKVYKKELEDRDYYLQDNVFWVPQNSRWQKIRGQAKQSDIGQIIDEALLEIENKNISLKGKLNKKFSSTEIDFQKLGGLVDIISTIAFGNEEKAGDILGEVYEYFLGKFAAAEGKKGGQFYTPRSVVKTLVEVLQPYKGRVYDPCCGSGGMFVQSENFIKNHGGRLDDISIYGQESNPTTWSLAHMNMSIRGFSANLGDKADDTFSKDQHSDLKFDYILANPHFNDSDWGGENFKKDHRWTYGTPPESNANYAWLQHIISKLKNNGRACIILANMSLGSNDKSESKIREGIIQDDLLECIINLPDKLFTTTPIGVCIWVINKNKNVKNKNKVLFIDANNDFEKITRTLNAFTNKGIDRVVNTYNTWINSNDKYKPEAGYSNYVEKNDILNNKGVLFPATYLKYKKVKFEKNDSKKLWLDINKKTLTALDDMSDIVKLSNNISKSTIDKKDYYLLDLDEVLEEKKERLLNKNEPEILTCTETSGLVFQRDRFASRVATDDTSKYKIVNEGDIVYNPYLLWAGAIDQCWIIEEGITSPAYQVFKVKDGFDKGLIGFCLKNDEMLSKYGGISIGTVKRRRRAPAEKFLKLKIKLPKIKDINFSDIYRKLRNFEQTNRLIKEGLNKTIKNYF